MKQSLKYIVVGIITGLRVPLSIVIYLILSANEAAGPIKAGLATVLALMVVMELSDMADGFLARRLGAVSTFGKYFDPLCDSIARLLVYLGLMQIGLVPAWLIIIIVVRDMILTFLYLLYYTETKQIYESRLSGKIKAIAQGLGAVSLVIFAMLKASGTVNIDIIRQVIVWFVAIVTVLSLLDYTRIVVFRSRLSRTVREPAPVGKESETRLAGTEPQAEADRPR